MPPTSLSRVVIAESFASVGQAVLREHGLEIVSLVGQPREALLAALADADALIVRSETRVDRALLAAGPRLQVVARAGVGVDAIDVDAATEAGILVLNTPAANTLAATEQTFALMLSLARNTPQAVQSLREGRWDRGPLVGTELAGKTLGIVGLGRIGGNVAQRAKAFGMQVVAHDPFISQARADAFDAELLELDELLARADIVTLHVPLNAQTLGMIDARRLGLLQPHAMLVNCARGGVIVEADLLDALDATRFRGAAIDVVAVEPPPPDGTGARLHRHPRVIATPHLGGSTHEALERIATELAHDVARVLLGSPATAAVNAPIPDGPDAERLRPFVEIAYRIGRFLPQFALARGVTSATLVLEGEIAHLDPAPLIPAFLSGLLQTTTDRRVSVVNAPAIARELGIAVDARGGTHHGPFAASLRVNAGRTTIVGTSINGSPRIVEVDGYEIDTIPLGALVMTQHRDVPGMVGRVGTVLGGAQINIAAMQVANRRGAAAGEDAIMVLSVDRSPDAATLDALRAIDGMVTVRALAL